MSETVPEETEEEVEETEEPDDTEAEDQDEQPADDAAKLKKALERERKAKKKALSDLAQLRKQAQEGDPNKGEMVKLVEQVEKLQQGIATKDRVTLLLEAGFNQSAAKAEKMLKLVDNFDDDEWIDELKTDYPERFGKKSRGDGDRPFTGGGRAGAGGQPKDPDERFAARLMNMGKAR